MRSSLDGSRLLLHSRVRTRGINSAHKSRQHTDGFGVNVVKQAPNCLVKIVGLIFGMEFSVAATFRTRLTFAVTVGTLDLCHVHDTVARFLRFLFVENLNFIEKPQRILRAVGVPEEPLMKPHVACIGTSFREDGPAAEASCATVLFNSTALALGADCSEPAARTTAALEKIFDFLKRHIAFALRVRNSKSIPRFATSHTNNISH